MDARGGERLLSMLEEAQVEVGVLEGIPDRLTKFVEPFTESILQSKQRRRAAEFIGGLLSDVERKNAESIAYRHDQERKEMQYFLGESRWDHQPLLVELARQVGRELGRPDGSSNRRTACSLFFIGCKMIRHLQLTAGQALTALLAALKTESAKWG
jgi:hypothetical protein